MRMNKKHLFMMAVTGTAGAALLTAGSYSLFSASTTTNSDTFAAGTVQIKLWDGDDCVGPDSSVAPSNLSVTHLLPGSARSQTFTVQNTGTLDEWIGVLARVPQSVPVQVSYTVAIYPPDPADGETSDPDSNGDVHSHCHTGSKGRGAGGEDKNGGDQGSDQPWHQYSCSWFNTSDTTPGLPFELPVGYHAHVTYTYQLTRNSKSDQNKDGSLNFDVWAVQYPNNVNTAGNGPISWAPQPAHN